MPILLQNFITLFSVEGNDLTNLSMPSYKENHLNRNNSSIAIEKYFTPFMIGLQHALVTSFTMGVNGKSAMGAIIFARYCIYDIEVYNFFDIVIVFKLYTSTWALYPLDIPSQYS